eukprot:gnl/MRDRNA2_/MRDRNA2_118757_c0_seq1.p1 gnl/MRDRNA2_/MRDRNA2_118757_c0~~gnl/MRDRNA2_/MRDRNA2_118757_c0_seq1.p1  ORF type:complete len:391 (-),score=80.77 gnl/MRDRNA2_/MRDRNA2_118757_c0_seq1:86-1258(-)
MPITLGPKPPSSAPVEAPKGVSTDSGTAPTCVDGQDSGSSVTSNVVAPVAAPVGQSEPQESGSAQGPTTIHVLPKQPDSAWTQPSQGISLGPAPTTIGAAQEPQLPQPQQQQHPTGHVSVPIKDTTPEKQAKPPTSNRGGIANGITFFLLVVGLVLQFVLDEEMQPYNFVLAIGVFGFAGGITNWLAVKMLFDKIPGLYGSGVIPMQYKNIRKTVKTEIMHTFFDEDYLKGYIGQRAPELLRRLNIHERLMKVINAPDFDEKMAAKLEEISATPQGMILAMVKPFMSGGLAGLVPMVKPPLVSIASEIAKELTTMEEQGNSEEIVELIPVDVVRSEIDALMTERLATLTPEVVKELLENVIRDHLGWLVVWGNIFGSIIGVIALAVTGEV